MEGKTKRSLAALLCVWAICGWTMAQEPNEKIGGEKKLTPSK